MWLKVNFHAEYNWFEFKVYMIYNMSKCYRCFFIAFLMGVFCIQEKRHQIMRRTVRLHYQCTMIAFCAEWIHPILILMNRLHRGCIELVGIWTGDGFFIGQSTALTYLLPYFILEYLIRRKTNFHAPNDQIRKRFIISQERPSHFNNGLSHTRNS